MAGTKGPLGSSRSSHSSSANCSGVIRVSEHVCVCVFMGKVGNK